MPARSAWAAVLVMAADVGAPPPRPKSTLTLVLTVTLTLTALTFLYPSVASFGGFPSALHTLDTPPLPPAGQHVNLSISMVKMALESCAAHLLDLAVAGMTFVDFASALSRGTTFDASASMGDAANHGLHRGGKVSSLFRLQRASELGTKRAWRIPPCCCLLHRNIGCIRSTTTSTTIALYYCHGWITSTECAALGFRSPPPPSRALEILPHDSLHHVVQPQVNERCC